MSLDSHLDRLKSDHRRLDAMLAQAQSRPGADTLEEARLKIQKLRLKDKMEELRRSHATH